MRYENETWPITTHTQSNKPALQKMLRYLFLCAVSLCLASSSGGPGSACLHVNTSTHRIVDPEEGRERYFHGVNVVVKGPPWLPELREFDPLKSFVEKDMQTLQELGLNAIRCAWQLTLQLER